MPRVLRVMKPLDRRRYRWSAANRVASLSTSRDSRVRVARNVEIQGVAQVVHDPLARLAVVYFSAYALAAQ